jgi:hypothetical protein
MDRVTHLKISRAALMLSSCFTLEEAERNLRIQLGEQQSDVYPTITKIGSGIFLGKWQPTAHMSCWRMGGEQNQPWPFIKVLQGESERKKIQPLSDQLSRTKKISSCRLRDPFKSRRPVLINIEHFSNELAGF